VALEQKARENTVAATSNFTTEFGDLIDRNISTTQVDGFFNFSGEGPACDCLTAAHVVQAKGLSMTLLPGELRLLWFTIGQIPRQSRRANHHNMLIGDYGHIPNHSDYLDRHPDGDWQGENVIKVGEGRFWGHPLGVMSVSEWEAQLRAEYNRGLDPADWKGIRPRDNGSPFTRGLVEFFDMAAVAEKVFDHRSSDPL